MSRSHRRTALRQSFSFHRLRDDAVAARIVGSTGLAPPARVYEFGAGDGVLTRALAPRAGQVIAIEIDRELHAGLATAVAHLPNIEAIHADFRDVALPRSGDYTVVANLPFSLTSASLRHLLGQSNPPAGMFLVVQREVAATWTGMAGSALRAVQASVAYSFDVPLALRQRDFEPWPRVHAVLLAARRRSRPLLAGPEARQFSHFVARGFGGGADVASNLRPLLPRRGKGVLARLGVEPGMPPSALAPHDWLALWRELRRG